MLLLAALVWSVSGELAPAQPSSSAETAAGALSGPAAAGSTQAARFTGTADAFPPLPPDPYENQREALPPLEEELWHHGGSYLYSPEGDRLNAAELEKHGHDERLRLPEDWDEPRPITAFTDFLGADPAYARPWLKWPGPGGYHWEPQFVAYGSWEVFGLASEQGNERFDALGQQLIAELDLRLTGTERLHVQFRPIGEGNTGGSYYQFSDPEGYVDNSTLEPTRYWFEGELHSLLGSYVDPFAAWDYHLVVGKFPFALHNALLMNDEITGLAVNKNTIYMGTLSNLNVQGFYAFDDVDTFTDADASLAGLHVTADHRRALYELTYARAEHERLNLHNSHWIGLSRTQFYGPLTLAARGFFKWGDDAGRGSGELFAVETNYTRVLVEPWLGIEQAVAYCNAFVATEGWNPISGGNFNRLRTAFEVNPLVRLGAGAITHDTAGVAMGVHLFRCHEDESFVPEIALEFPEGEPVVGTGMRYLRKTGPRSYLETLSVVNFSEEQRFERQGVFISHSILF